jgi:primosomal protein N' (replication factor Y)
VVVVDIRNDPYCGRGEAIGRALHSSMRLALDDGGQIILLQNLRGYSPVLWCSYCGKTARCPHCDVTLTWHKDRDVVLCHSCEYQSSPPARCSHCDRPTMKYFGTGTQRLEREVRTKFPGVACLRMDSDAMRRPGSHDAALTRFREGEVRILLGTQMIAKGLDFPDVTLVGVIDADTMLHQTDLRAAERTFQLLSQVAGRTGRGARGGRVFIQSSIPSDPAIRKAAEHDYLGFVAGELRHRREQNAPPFAHLARVIVRGLDEPTVKRYIEELAENLGAFVKETGLAVRILGPAPAQVARIKNHYRYHLRLSAPQIESIHAVWRQVAQKLPTVANVEHAIDVDPINMR